MANMVRGKTSTEVREMFNNPSVNEPTVSNTNSELTEATISVDTTATSKADLMDNWFNIDHLITQNITLPSTHILIAIVQMQQEH